jgi:antitoxin component YwqK of YwqJK toxin-antitoxin module
MNRICTILLLAFTVLTGCNGELKPIDKSERLRIDNFSNYLFQLKKIDSKSVLDSIKILTDFSMKDTAEYKRNPKATLFINEAAQTRFQVFENPKESITAIAYFRQNKMINVAEYYDNGQAMCVFSVNEAGQREGPYECFFEDGSFRIKGFYKNGKEVSDSIERFENNN